MKFFIFLFFIISLSHSSDEYSQDDQKPQNPMYYKVADFEKPSMPEHVLQEKKRGIWVTLKQLRAYHPEDVSICGESDRDVSNYTCCANNLCCEGCHCDFGLDLGGLLGLS